MSFTDPVVRCVDCASLITRQDVQKFGMCPNCGCKRVKNVLIMNDKEINELKEKNISPEFIALFEPVSNG